MTAMRRPSPVRGPLLRMVGLALLATPLLSGCLAMGGDAAYSAAFRTKFVDAGKLTPEEVQQVHAMAVYDAPPAQAFTSDGKVTGLACQLSVAPLVPMFRWVPKPSDLNGLTPRDVAMTQMKIKALRAGGNAVVGPTCEHHAHVDWGNNCFESWSCTGEAVQLAPQ